MKTNWNGLELSEVTTCDSMNGYPSDIIKAVVDFETIEQAQEYAYKFGGRVFALMRKDGWNTWYRENETCREYDVNAEDYGYSTYIRCGDFMSLKDDINELVAFNEDCEDSFQYLTNLNFIANLATCFSNLKDNEQILLGKDGDPFIYEVAPQQTMSCSYDTKHYTIGVVDWFGDQSETKREDIESCVRNILSDLDVDMVNRVVDLILDDVIEDIEECADEEYTNSDVSIALGRVLAKKLGIEL